MSEGLLQLDRYLFGLVNGSWHNSAFDAIMPLLRDKLFWIPVYLLIAIWLTYRYRWAGLWVLMFTVLAVAVGDQLSSAVIKPWVNRLRPCHEAELSVRLLVECGAGRSFTSSHATNHFALSVFLAFQLGGGRRWLISLLIAWAALVAWAQVYVGVHYPFDVLAGALLGSLIGMGVSALKQAIPATHFRI